MKEVILLTIAAILLVVGSVLGTLYFGEDLGLLKGPSPAQADGADPDAPAPPGVPPTYVALDPAFTVSFNSSETARYFQVEIEVATHEPSVEEALKIHRAAIRNGLLMLLSSVQPAKLLSREDKEALRGAVLEEIRQILTALTGKPGVVDVYFTGFLIQ